MQANIALNSYDTQLIPAHRAAGLRARETAGLVSRTIRRHREAYAQ